MSIVINTDPAERRRAFHQKVVWAFLLVGFVALVVGVKTGGLEELTRGFNDPTGKKIEISTLGILGGVVFLLTGAAFGMLIYLRPALADAVLSGLSVTTGVGAVSFYSDGPMESTLRVLKRQVSELRGKVLQDRTTDANELAELLRPAVQDSILEQLQTKYSSESLDATRLTEVRNVYVSLENRLRLEIDSLGLRSNINLTIGVITTLLAVAALAFMVFTSDRKFDSMIEVLAHYVPRLALVVFIEIFSFFFLRLYRSTLEEIRLYQQKLNDAATQKVAIELAWALNDPTARAELAKTLLTTQQRQEAITHSGDVDVDALTKAIGQLLKLMPSGSTAKPS